MTLRKWSELLVVSALTFLNVIFKIVLRNASLWLWDDVRFAYEVQHGSLYAQSPGYLGYMIIGRFFYLTYRLFTGELLSEQPMILLSALLGGLTPLPVYLLIRNFLGKRALTGCLFIMVAPLFAEMSAQVDSDIPSTFFITLSVALFYVGLKRNDQRILLLSALTYGFSVQFRLTNLVMFPFFIVVINREWSLSKPRKSIALFILTAVSSVIVGYVPLLYYHGLGGFMGFMMEYHEVNAVRYTVVVMRERVLSMILSLIEGVTLPAVIICLIGFHSLFLRQRTLFYDLLLWILPYTSFFLLYGPNSPRFYLPIYPALSLLFAYGLEGPTIRLGQMLDKKWRNVNNLASIGFLVLIFTSMIIWSLPTYDRLIYWSYHQSPEKQFTLWMKEVAPSNSVIVAGEYCWLVKYYTNLPDPIWSVEPSWVSYSVNKELENGRRVFLVSTLREKCEFLTEQFELKAYAYYNELLGLYEILP